MAGKALTAVIQEAHVQGISTRSIDDLVKAIGMDGSSKSLVSRPCKEIDEKVLGFLHRPLEGLIRMLTVPNRRIPDLARCAGRGASQSPSIRCSAKRRRHWQARVRSTLRRPRHLTPSGPAAASPDQRHGRAVQWPDRGGAAEPPFPIRRGTGGHAAQIRLALQPATPAISPRQQDPLAGNEGLAQTEARGVQETAISSSGM